MDTGAGFTGTARADTFTATQTTLNAGDNLVGGDGTDTLQITSNAASAVAVGGDALVSGIEVVSTTATVSAVDVSLASFGGVTTVQSVGSTAAVTYSNVQVIPVVNLTGTSANLTVGMAAAAVAGLADAMTINLSSVANANTLTPTTVTVNGIETITVDATGASGVGFLTDGVTPRTILITSDALRSLTVTGTGTAKIDAVMNGAQSGTTGAAATVTGSAGVDDMFITVPLDTSKLNVQLGTGNDSLFVSRINAFTTLNGGDGTDTLVYNGALAADATATAGVTLFENVQMRSGVSFALATSNLTYTVAAAGTYTGLAAGGTVALQQGGTLTLANTALTGTTDAVTVTVGTATATTPVAATIAAGTHDVVTVTGVARSDTLATTSAAINVTGTTLNTITLNSSQGVTLAGGGTALTTINASGVAGAFSSTATTSSTAAVTITGGAGSDAITGGAFADSLVGGAGNDTITGGLGADTMTGGAGSDVFVIAANTGVTAATAVSTSTITDTITDFVSGTDRLQLGQPVTSFVGNVNNIQLGLAAMTAANQAFFVTSENTLYVVATFGGATGALSNTDTLVRLTGVTALVGTDLAISSTAVGADLTLSNVGGTSVANLTAAAGTLAVATTGFTGAVLTTGFNDTVRATPVQLDATGGGAVSTITGGNGVDTLVLSGGNATGQTTAAELGSVTGFESIQLVATTVTGGTTTAFDIILDDANVTENGTLEITAATLTTVAVRIDAQAVNAAATRAVNITGSAFATGVDTLIGGTGNDTISGGAGNDQITGGTGNDSLTGGDGDDTFVVADATGTDVITGGAGNDILDLTGAIGTSATSLSSVDLGVGVNRVTLATGANLANSTISATGGVYGITLANGGTASMTQAQFSGAFEVIGGAVETLTFTTNGTVNVSNSTVERFVLTSGTATTGTNAVTVGANQTIITGGTGADTITASAAGTHTLNLDTGDDVINMGTFLTTADTLTGAGGNDTLNFTNPGAAAATALDNVIQVETINFTAVVGDGVAANQRALNIITVTDGGAFDADTVAFTFNHATAFAATLNFGAIARATTIVAAGGDDVITGGAGTDNITGGAGADTIVAGAGADVISGGAAADVITGGLGGDTMTGGAGIDNFLYAVAAGDGIAASTLTNLDRIVDYRLATGDNAGALDTVTLTGIIGGGIVAGTVATVQDLSAQTSLGAALNVAANNNAVASGFTVFIFGGNTYAYIEAVANGTAYVATDFLLQLDGLMFNTSTALTNTGFVLG